MSLQSERLSYVRTIYASEIDWYRVADSKGQLLLGLNGAYVTVVTAIVLLPQGEVTAVRAAGTPTLALLAGACVAAFVSITCAICCLYSQLSDARLDGVLAMMSQTDRGTGRVSRHPVVTFWFGTLARLDADECEAMLRTADASFELEALARR